MPAIEWFEGSRDELADLFALAVLRFYQRLGFRLLRIEPDAFTPEAGYPDIEIDGIPLRDRVWLSLSLREAAMPGDA
jgi:hypothetical protein